jgi:hypothetical protein
MVTISINFFKLQLMFSIDKGTYVDIVLKKPVVYLFVELCGDYRQRLVKGSGSRKKLGD